MLPFHASLRNALLVSPLLLSLGVGACLDDVEDYRLSLPTADEIKITTPSKSGSSSQGLGVDVGGGVGIDQSALTGKTSEFYQVTLAISAELNTRAGILLGLMRLSTLGTPSESTLTSRTWGPRTPGGQDPLTYQVVVTKLGPGHFSYSFEAHLAAQASQAFSPLVSGDVTRGVAGGQAKGEVVLHYDNLRALKTDSCEVGTIRSAFDGDGNGVFG